MISRFKSTSWMCLPKTLGLSCCLLLAGVITTAQDISLSGNEIVLSEPIHFKAGSSTLSEENKQSLLTLINFLQEKPYISKLRIEAHLATGQNDAQKLSEKRALAVAQWLAQQNIDCKRLVPVGFGSKKPIAENANKEANTRINFVIAALRDRLIGNMPADGGGKISVDPCSLTR